MQDGDARARREFTLLVGAPIHGVVEEIPTSSAVIEQRVALTRCAATYQGLARPLGANQKVEQGALRLLHSLGEGGIGVKAGESCVELPLAQRADRRGNAESAFSVWRA
jgi:hypothetical protein